MRLQALLRRKRSTPICYRIVRGGLSKQLYRICSWSVISKSLGLKAQRTLLLHFINYDRFVYRQNPVNAKRQKNRGLTIIFC